MLVARICEGNPFVPSRLNTSANTFGSEVNGRGVFVFRLGAPVEHFDAGYPDEPLTLDYLEKQFGEWPGFMSVGKDCCNVHVFEVDDEEVVATGYGFYAEPEYRDWYDRCALPEAYIVFKED